MVTMAYLEDKQIFDIDKLWAFREKDGMLSMELDYLESHSFKELVCMAKGLNNFSKNVRIKYYYNKMNGPDFTSIDFIVHFKDCGHHLERIDIFEISDSYKHHLFDPKRKHDMGCLRNYPIFFKDKLLQLEYEKIFGVQKTFEDEMKELNQRLEQQKNDKQKAK